MYITYYFGTILESNSYLQNMVTTFIFIILCNAPTITHGDVKLQINYFDLLSYSLLLSRFYYSLNMYTDLELY